MSWRTLLRSLLALAPLAAASPTLAQLPPLVSEEAEAQQGAQAHPVILRQYGGIYDDHRIGVYVAQVGARLLAAADQRGQEYTFSVLDSDVPNAFALPGGYAYVTRGLLAIINTEAELAGVMGHEIGHVVARHSAQRNTGALFAGLLAGAVGQLLGSSGAAQLAGLIGQGALAQYSQSQEYEADQLGVRYMRAAGWNPLAQADMLSALKRQSDLLAEQFGTQQGGVIDDIFASHPNTLERIAHAAGLARQAGADGDYGREAWLRHTDGLMYGGSPRSGYVRGRQFIHSGLRIAFTAPPGWALQNGASQVVARGRDGTLIFDADRPQGGNADPSDYLRNVWLKDVRLEDLQSLRVDGRPAASATALLQTQSGGTQPVYVLAIKASKQQYYRFQAVLRTNDHDLLREVGRAFLSFRRLSQAEAAAVKPWRVRIFRVDPGDTIASLSQMMVLPQDKEQTFRVLNALDRGATVNPGELVKIVIEDDGQASRR